MEKEIAMDDIKQSMNKITEYLGSIEKAMKEGSSIEIHASKDGVKVYEVKKKIIKK